MSNQHKSTSITKQVWFQAALIFVVSFILRLLFLAYKLDFELRIVDQADMLQAGGSDAWGWLAYGLHFTTKGFSDYWMMAIRPPLYPLSAALVYGLGGGHTAVAILQVIFGALTPVLGYFAARLVFLRIDSLPRKESLAFGAGLVMAFDPASVSAGATLLSEPLFNLMMTAFLLCLIAYLIKNHWSWLLLTALFMALSMLARPTAIYIWLLMPFVFVPLVKQWWKPALLLLVVGLAVNFGWSYRNLVHRGVFTYSMQPNFTLLFLRALSAEYLATGASTDDIQKDYTFEVLTRVGEDVDRDDLSSESFWQFHAASSPEIYETMGQVARERLLTYWPFAAAGTVVGAWRMYALTLTLPVWTRPIEILYHIALYGLMLFGAWSSFRNKQWLMLLTCGLLIFYVTGLTLASQTSAMDTRMRSPVSIPIIILAVYGFAILRRQLQSRAASPVPE